MLNRRTSNLARVALPTTYILAAMLLSGCAAIEDIFKAGVWVGVVAIVVLLAVVGGLGMLFKKR